jgi:hypothetical protein
MVYYHRDSWQEKKKTYLKEGTALLLLGHERGYGWDETRDAVYRLKEVKKKKKKKKREKENRMKEKGSKKKER